MPGIRYHVDPEDEELRAGFDVIRAEFGIVGFSDQALADAHAAAAAGPTVPPGAADDRADRRDLTLVAIDPPGSRDLDQAFGAERLVRGYRVHYAIADVAAFVSPGSELESESLARGVTLYAPDRRDSLHPPVINEEAASLLAGQDRPSVLWTIDLDADGEIVRASVQRATVRVAAAISYREAQARIDGPAPCEPLALLAEIGRHRQRLERERGAVSLALPSQEVTRDATGHVRLVYDETSPVEGWNAQISLLTGIAAARLMVGAGIGMLRTLPPPDPETIASLRRTAQGLHVPWPAEQSYADRVRDLDPTDPQEVAMLMRAARGLRGAGYVAFTSPDLIPDEPEHSAIASIYAHVTAPLRRVCDRYTNEVLLAICGDRSVPSWAVETLAELPSIMGRARQRERGMERAIIDFVEAMLLDGDVGREFDAVVVNQRGDRAVIQLDRPAVIANIDAELQLGAEIRVRLASVDAPGRHVRFERVR